MRKILVIDDDAALRKALKMLLEKAGYVVSEAENGRDGLNKIEAVGPDLVLTDIVMPEQDGIETVQLARSRFPGIKIIAMSGGGPMGADDLLSIAKKLGANGALSKPFNNEALRTEVQRVLDGERVAE